MTCTGDDWTHLKGQSPVVIAIDFHCHRRIEHDGGPGCTERANSLGHVRGVDDRETIGIALKEDLIAAAGEEQRQACRITAHTQIGSQEATPAKRAAATRAWCEDAFDLERGDARIGTCCGTAGRTFSNGIQSIVQHHVSKV